MKILEKNRDQYIKEKLQKDKLISKKADDVFNEFLKGDFKMNNEEKIVKKSKWRKILATAASLVIVLGAANIYATTQGYENIFFMIKYLVIGEQVTINEKSEILSDRDMSISYEPIKLTEKIEMQIASLQVKDNETRLKIVISESEPEEDTDVVPLSYKVYNSSGEELCNQVSIKTELETNYTEELMLNNYKESDKILKLEVYKANLELITRITIDLENRTITVLGEEEALKKISEIELKEYLGYVAGYTNSLEKENSEELQVRMAIDYLALKDKLDFRTLKNIELDGYNANDIEKVIEEISGQKLENEEEGNTYTRYTEEETDYFVLDYAADIVVKGECIDIPSISYCGGLYTVTYTYCFLGENSIFDVDINDFDIYQNTVIIKLNENAEFCEFQLVYYDEARIIKSKENKEEGTIIEEIIYDNNQSQEQFEQIENQIDNYATSMSWTKYWAPGLRFEYPTEFYLEEVGGENRGNQFGSVSTVITGVATGIDIDTKEIIESNMTIEIYEPEPTTCTTQEEYNKEVAKELLGEDFITGGYMTTNDGLSWYESLKITNDGETKQQVFTNYNSEFGMKILITIDTPDNYKVLNITNWFIGSTEATSY